MAKLRNQTITAKDIEEYLATQDDFDLELYVYRTAKKLGLSATHGGTYEDPITEKPRQFDVRAGAERGNHRIDLAIECKSLRASYPLLLSRIPRSEEESFHQVIYSYHPPRRRLGTSVDPLDVAMPVWLEGNQSIYRPKEKVAKSTVQVGRNEKGELIAGDNEIFDKWSQALGSAGELVASANYACQQRERQQFFTCVLPILVITDNTLWVADYSQAGALEAAPRQVDEATLFVGRRYSSKLLPTYTLSHLHIYTRSKIGQFLDQVANDGNLWQSIFPEAAIQKAIEKG